MKVTKPVSNCSGSQMCCLTNRCSAPKDLLCFSTSQTKFQILDNRQTTRKVKFTLRIVIQTKKWSIIILQTFKQLISIGNQRQQYCLVWASRLRCLPRCPFPLVSPTKWEEGLLDHRLYRCLQSLSAKFAGSCLLWVMSTEISVDIAVDIAVDSRSIVGR